MKHINNFIKTKQTLTIDAFNKLTGGGYIEAKDLEGCNIDKVIIYAKYYYIFLHTDGEYSLELGRDEYVDTNLNNLEKLLFEFLNDIVRV
tara:strand:+ start:3598 stop:3867 length:270 start_codon:yes stop_codon:yes gene_type:complete